VNNKASVSWSGYDVILDLDDYYNNSIAKSEDGAILSGDARNATIQTAWMLWCNDSFWLYAPYKLNDKGVTRSVIILLAIAIYGGWTKQGYLLLMICGQV